MKKFVCYYSDGNLVGVDGYNGSEPFPVKPFEWNLAYFWNDFDHANKYAAKFDLMVRPVSLLFHTDTQK
jgi:hypothetical protein